MVNRKIENFEKLIAAQTVDNSGDEVDAGLRSWLQEGNNSAKIRQAIKDITEIKRPAARQKCKSLSIFGDEKSQGVSHTLPRSRIPHYRKHNPRDYQRVVSCNGSVDMVSREDIDKKVEEFGHKLRQKVRQSSSFREESTSKQSEQKDQKPSVAPRNFPIQRTSFKTDDSEQLLENQSQPPTLENQLQSEEDIFGVNEFDDDDNDNFILEAFNEKYNTKVTNDKRYLIMTYYQISHQVVNKHTKEEDILEMSKHSDVTIRRGFRRSSNVSVGHDEKERDSLTKPLHMLSECINQELIALENIELKSNSSENLEVRIKPESSEQPRTPLRCSYEFPLQSREDEEKEFSDNYYSLTHDFSSGDYEVFFSKDLYDDNGNMRVQTIVKGLRPVFKSVEIKKPPTPPPKESTSKMTYIIEELIITEEQYVAGLEKVVTKYQAHINKNFPKHIIGKQAYLFGNIKDIYKQAQKFLVELKRIPRDPVLISMLFLNWESMFNLYPLYSKNKPTADVYLKEFDDIIKKRQKALKDKLDLASYLLTPIQRLGKYVLFLENMQKEIVKMSADASSTPTEISKAIDMMKRIMRRGNDCLAIDSIKNCKVDLAMQGSFIMREKFNVVRHKKKYECMVFLFDKIIVFTLHSQKNAEEFNYLESIPMTDVTIACYEEQPLMFQLFDFPKTKRGNSEEFTFVLYARTAKIKNIWTHAISTKLWDQLKNAKIQQKQLHDDQGKRYSNVTLPNVELLNNSEEHLTRKSVFYVDNNPQNFKGNL